MSDGLSALLLSFAMTAFCGMSMSGHAVPFLYGMTKVSFAFLDYEKAGILVFVENVLMLLFWGFIGTEAAVLCRNSQMKTEDKKNPLLPVVFIMGAIIIGLVINMISGSTSGQSLTAIAKLAPDADMGEGLSVHYSGVSTLSDDIQKWLDVNGINK